MLQIKIKIIEFNQRDDTKQRMSQRKLALECIGADVSEATKVDMMQKWCSQSNYASLKPDHIIKMAAILKTTPNDLLGWKSQAS